MEFIPSNPLLEFHTDTLQAVRKLYNLDQPGRMTDAVNIIEDWAKKQNHFVKKEFSREFLERVIITNKGLLERVKLRLDKTCTLRTLVPHFFGSFNVKEDFQELLVLEDAILPKLTPDNCRVFLTKNMGKEFSNTFFLNFCRRSIILWEYLIKHDYNAGFFLVLDLSECNLVDFVAKMGITELRQLFGLFLEGYGMRLKGIHIITTSKFVYMLIGTFKQFLSAKLGERIYSHANIEPLYAIIPKDMLPIEYGGKEKPLSELHDKWLDLLSSKEHMEYMDIVNAARTDESLRPVDKFNEQHLGIPGTFRTMVVD